MKPTTHNAFTITCKCCASQNCRVTYLEGQIWSENTCEPTEATITCDNCGQIFDILRNRTAQQGDLNLSKHVALAEQATQAWMAGKTLKDCLAILALKCPKQELEAISNKWIFHYEDMYQISQKFQIKRFLPNKSLELLTGQVVKLDFLYSADRVTLKPGACIESRKKGQTFKNIIELQAK